MNRFIIAIEIDEDETEDFLDAFRAFMKVKAPDIKHAIHPVVLKD